LIKVVEDVQLQVVENQRYVDKKNLSDLNTIFNDLIDLEKKNYKSYIRHIRLKNSSGELGTEFT
jgi:hypothetical protein